MPEWKRVFFSRRVLGLLLFLIALNVFVPVFQLRQNGYGLREYRDAYLRELRRFQAMPAAEALAADQREAARWNTLQLYASAEDETLRAMLREQCAADFGEDFEQRLADGSLDISPEAVRENSLRQEVWRELSAQLLHLSSYPAYLDAVHSSAASMAGLRVFYGADDFGLRNIERTDRDFPTAVELRLDNDLAVSALLDSRLPGCSCFVFIAALVLRFLEERKRGLWPLVYGAPKGRARLALQRSGILLLGAALAVLFLFGACLLTYCAACGGPGDLSRAVQSIAAFQSFPDVMSLRSFLLLYALYSVLGLWLLGLILWAVLQAVSSFHLALLFAGLLLALEYALFTLIPDSYSVVLLRYLNLFALVDPSRVFLRYLNVKLFGYAVRGSRCTLLAMPVGILASGAACVGLQAKKYPIQRQAPLLRLLERAQRLTQGIPGRLHLFGLELHKLLWQQRGALVLIAFAVWTFAFQEAPPVDTGLYDPASAVYEIKYQGPVGEETRAALRSELEKAAQNDAGPASAEAVKGLTLLLQRVDGALQRGEALELVNPVPYAALMNRNAQNAQRLSGLMSMLFVILALSGLYAYEKQSRMLPVLRSSAGAGRVRLTKTGLSLAAAVFLWFAASLREIRLIETSYAAFGGLSAPARSLPMFADVSPSLTVGAMLARYFLLRLLVLAVLAQGVSFLSLLCGSQNAALLVNAGVFLLPAALSSVGLPLFDRLSLVRLLSPLECRPAEYLLCAALGFFFLIAVRLVYQKRS